MTAIWVVSVVIIGVVSFFLGGKGAEEDWDGFKKVFGTAAIVTLAIGWFSFFRMSFREGLYVGTGLGLVWDIVGGYLIVMRRKRYLGFMFVWIGFCIAFLCLLDLAGVSSR